ncbi:MAG: hypothetical protein ACYTFI_19690, partial [Planctomycetota bacterium]
TEEGTIKILAFVGRRGGFRLVPEWFDIYSKWVLHGPVESHALSTVVVNPGFPALEWLACDEGANMLWSTFGKHIPQARRWNQFRTSHENAQLQREWRTEMPKWLRAHPETRSYWVQRWHANMAADHWSLSEDPKIGNADAIGAELKIYQRDFAEELTDRRGICAEVPWGKEWRAYRVLPAQRPVQGVDAGAPMINGAQPAD